ncbi:MAG TPA: lysophospholipid acyltransferase family protein [Bauldia sp.]|nr:lysophospholipid acyltransferase family protein [Bauldia sp.]
MIPPRNPAVFGLKVRIRQLPGPVVDAIRRLLDRLLGFTAFNAIYARLPPSDTDNFAATLLAGMDVRVEWDGAPKETVPLTGPLVVVANHPFGMVEGMALGAFFSALRSDVSVMVLHLLSAIPEYRERLIFVEPRPSPKRRMQNAAGWMKALRWLGDGGVVAVFPAGLVARYDWRRRKLVDRPWSPRVAGLIRRSGATVIPVWFHGGNGWLFQVLGTVAPGLQDALLMRQMVNKRGATLRAALGTPIAPERLAAFPDDAAAIAFLRAETEKLGPDGATRPSFR